MSTTPNRGAQPASKYLTPCRRFGLKRRTTPKNSPFSSPVVSSAHQVDNKEKTINCTTSPSSHLAASPLSSKIHACDTDHSTPSSSLKKGANERKLSIANKAKRIKLDSTNANKQTETIKTNSVVQLCQYDNDDIENSEITKEMLKNLIMVINKKSDNLTKLMTTSVYARKHDLSQLQKSTEKWKNTCKEALEMLLLETKKQGLNCNMLDIMAAHNIPPELLDFDCETHEFQ